MSIVAWFQQLAYEMVQCGLDTVFRVTNSDWTSETYLLEKWGRITHSSVILDWMTLKKEFVILALYMFYLFVLMMPRTHCGLGP